MEFSSLRTVSPIQGGEMSAKTFVTAVLIASMVPSAHAQTVHHVGFISPIAPGPTIEAFRSGLREQGYIEGQNLIIEARFADGHMERLPGLIADVVRSNVEVMVVGSEVGVQAAKKVTTTVPVVFAGVSDASDIVPDFAHPSANMTGFTFGVGGSGFGGKWVELMKEVLPGLARVAVLSNSADPQTRLLLLQIREAALRFKVDVHVIDARRDVELPGAFAKIGKSGAQAMIVTNTPLFAANRAKIVDFAARRRLPAIYFFRLFTDAGGLMSYGGNLEETYRRAASYVDRILKGARPADLPVQQPTRLELIVNLKTARAQGIKLPDSLVLRADEVVE